MPSVSVIIATYNRANVLPKAIASVAGQSYQDFELLVVDDASRDNTESTLLALRSHFPSLAGRLRYLRLPRRAGANTARNAGAARATGRYLAFLDSDDIWHPTKLEKQMKAVLGMEATRPAFCFTGRYRVDESYAVIARQLPQATALSSRIRRSNAVGTLSSVLVDATLARSIGLFDERLTAAQDWEFYIRVLPFCDVVGISEPLVMYFDGQRDRITSGARERLKAHLRVYALHQKGLLTPRELADMYLVIAEDLARTRHSRLAARFYARHLSLNGRWVRAARTCLAREAPNLREQRYRGYRAAERKRQSLATERCRYLEFLADFRPFIDFELG